MSIEKTLEQVDELEKKIFVKIVIYLFAFIILITVMNNVGYTFDRKFKGKIDNRIIASYKGGNVNRTFLFSEMPRLIWFDKGKVVPIGINNSVITSENGTGRTSVRSVMTNDKYVTYHPGIEINRGFFIDKDAMKDGSRVIVISEKTAHRLFMSLDVIGYKILLDGALYTVCGVYKKAGGILSFLSSDGSDEIYIPYSSVAKWEERPVDVLVVNEVPDVLTGIHGVVNLRQTFTAVLEKNSSLYTFIDFHYAEVAVHRYLGLFFFVVGILGIIMIARLIVSYTNQTVKQIKMKLRDYYLPDLIRNEYIFVSKSLVILLILIGCGYWITTLMGFTFDIPDQYIPRDNLFDIEFYINQIQSTVQAFNTAVASKYNIYGTAARNAININLVLLIPACFCFIETMWSIKAYKSISTFDTLMSSIKKGVGIIAVLICGLLTGYILSYIMGLSFMFPGKHILITAILLALSYLSVVKVDKSTSEESTNTLNM